MINPVRDGFLASAKSPITIGAVIVYGVLFIWKIANGSEPTAHAWSYIFPIISDPLWITLIPLTWLFVWILPRAIAGCRDLELVRAGSRKTVLLLEFAHFIGAVLALVLLLCSCLFGISSQSGIEFHWNQEDLSNTVQFSAYSSKHFASWFSTPLEAIIATALFSIFGLITIGHLIMTLAISGHLRVAVLVAATLWLWLLISSFSPLNLPPFFDGSILISLGWALSKPAGLLLATFWWSLFWLTSMLIVSISKVGKPLKAFVSDRLWVTICCITLAFVLSLNAVLKTKDNYASYVSQVFTGPLTDLVGFLLQAAIPLIISTAVLSRLIEIKGGFYEFQLIRIGNSNSWIRREATKEIIWAGLAISTLFPLVFILGTYSYGIPDAPSILNLFRGLFGFFSITTLQIALGFAIFQFFQSASTVWLVFVAFALFTGFWFPNLTTYITFVVPTSLDDVLQSKPLAWPAEAVALLFSAILYGFLLLQSKLKTGLSKNLYGGK